MDSVVIKDLRLEDKDLGSEYMDKDLSLVGKVFEDKDLWSEYMDKDLSLAGKVLEDKDFPQGQQHC